MRPVAERVLGILGRVRHVGHLARPHRTGGRGAPVEGHREDLPEGFARPGVCVHGGEVQRLPVKPQNDAERGPAQRKRTGGDRIEHRLRVRVGAGDDAKDLGRGRLLLQRDAEVGVAHLQLLEQAHVLDGDDGLVGEGLRSLTGLGERGDRSVANTEDADDLPPSQ